MDATSRTDVLSKELTVKKTWFHSLALTLGVTSVPSIASAQYTIGEPGGISASSFNARQIPPLPPSSDDVRRNALQPKGQTSLAAYAQNSPIGSGIPGGQVHVPGRAIDNSVLNSQYQAAPQYAAPAVQSYEQIQMVPSAPQLHSQPTYAPPQTTYAAPQTTYGAPETIYAAPQSAPAQMGTSSCPACSSGHCATHGVGVASSPMVSTVPSYGYGAAESCYSEPGISCGPTTVSPNRWIFGANALIFNRLNDDYVQLTTNTQDGADLSPAPNPYVQSFLSTNDASMRATGGVQFNVGRYFCDGRYAVMGTYWGVFSNPQSATILATDQVNGNLRSNLPLTLRGPAAIWQYGINMPVGTYPAGAGPEVYHFYDGAAAHRILRDQEYHSAELNFFSFALGGGARQAYAAGGCGDGRRVGYGSGAVRSLVHGGLHGGNGGDPCQSDCGTAACSGPTGPCAPWYGAQCSKLRLNMYGGVRWFRFRDSLEYAASATDTVFNSGADDFYYRNGVTNDLVGFQLGSLATWCTGTRLNLFGGTNFGVYGNRIDATTFAGTATQTAHIMSRNDAFDGRPYDYSSTLNGVAFLGEGTLGTGLRISRGWTANVAYRLVGVTGVATAVGQIPRDFADGTQITHINNNHSLLLHGVSLGANYNF